jgi:hypothetical protein
MADDWEAEDWEAEDFKPKLPATTGSGAGASELTAGEALLAKATGPDESKFAGEDEGDDDEEDEAVAKQPSQVRFRLRSIGRAVPPPPPLRRRRRRRARNNN